MESLARTVALIALGSTALGATVGGVAARSLAKGSGHQTAATVTGAVVGAVCGFLALPLVAKISNGANR